MSIPAPSPRAAVVRDVMTRPALTVATTASLWDAWQLLFSSGLRHLVVLDAHGSVVGVLSDRNILIDVPATAEHLGRRLVAEVMAQVPWVFVTPDDSPAHAADVMSANLVEAVPVLDDAGSLVGLVTESDIVRWVSPPRS